MFELRTSNDVYVLLLLCLFPVAYANDWSNLLGYNFFVLFYVLPVWCVCTTCLLDCLVPAEAKRGCQIDHWELELHMAMSHHMGAENWTRVLQEQPVLSSELSHQPGEIIPLKKMCVYVHAHVHAAVHYEAQRFFSEVTLQEWLFHRGNVFALLAPFLPLGKKKKKRKEICGPFFNL